MFLVRGETIMKTTADFYVNAPLPRMGRSTAFGFASLACFALCLSNAFAMLVLAAPRIDDDPVAAPPQKKTASLVRVSLPLTAESESRILASLDALASNLAGDRPVAVLEFVSADADRTQDGQPIALGALTPFERALSLARWLSGPRGNRLRSVAYIPNTLRGHAVLIALACEEIAMHPSAEIGLAGLDEPVLENTVLQAYVEIASRRATFPPAAVRSMLDPSDPLVRLDLDGGGVEYIGLRELESGGRPDKAWKETQLVPANQMASFSGQELRNWRWIAHAVNQRELLSPALQLNVATEERPVFNGPRKAVRLEIRGNIQNRLVNRTIRAIDESLNAEGTNLILIDLDSPGGSLEESLRLAYHLAEIPNQQAEVVVYVSGRARGDASLIAMAADRLVMHPDAILGQSGAASIDLKTLTTSKDNLLRLARTVGRSPGDIAGCLCPEAPVKEFLAADGRRTRSLEDWLDDDRKLPLWKPVEDVDFREGLTAARAQQLGIAADRASSLEAVGQQFGIERLPSEKQTNRTEAIIEWIASQRWLSFILFMIGIVCLSAELNSPGIGIAGAIALVCFLLFFWLNLFQGTIEWLEILLIVAGIACLAVEIFVLPGFGIFGVLGLLLLALGLVLASQSFVIPTNSYQRDQFILSFGQLALGFVALLGLAIAFRNQLANLPMVRWFALTPPLQDRFVVQMHELDEARRSLLGRYGTTLTRCNPYGKAIVGDDVIDVVTQGEWLDSDAPIEVVDVRQRHITVKRRRI